MSEANPILIYSSSTMNSRLFTSPDDQLRMIGPDSRDGDTPLRSGRTASVGFAIATAAGQLGATIVGREIV